MLVLRRVLSNQRGVKYEQRENFFHSRCTVEGKVCSLTIDGDHREKPNDHQAQPKEDSLKLQEVKEVAKLCRKLVFMPEEVMPPSFRNFPVFVCTFGLTKVDPQLEAPYGFEA